MFNQKNIKKLKKIITYLGLGRTKEIRNFFDNLAEQPYSDDVNIRENLTLFENLISDKAFYLINNQVICTDEYGLEFFKLIEEFELKRIQSLLLKKGFKSNFFNKLSRTRKCFNIPEALKQSKMEAFLEQPLDLSK